MGAKKAPVFQAQPAIDQSQKMNLQTGQQNQALSTIGQRTELGDLLYTTEIDPITGLPKYVANQQYSQDQKGILDRLESGMLGFGDTLSGMISNLFPQYNQQPDLVGKASEITDASVGPMNDFWNKFMLPEKDQLRTQLINQGLTEGSPAYQQQMDKLTNQQNLTKGAWLENFMPQAFNMAKQNFQLPLENAMSLISKIMPGNIKQNLVDTPGSNIANTDVMGALGKQWESQKVRAEQSNAFTNALMSGGIGLVSSMMGMPVNPMSMFGSSKPANPGVYDSSWSNTAVRYA